MAEHEYWGMPRRAHPADGPCPACGGPMAGAGRAGGPPAYACARGCEEAPAGLDHFALMMAAAEEYVRVSSLSRPPGCPDHAR